MSPVKVPTGGTNKIHCYKQHGLNETSTGCFQVSVCALSLSMAESAQDVSQVFCRIFLLLSSQFISYSILISFDQYSIFDIDIANFENVEIVPLHDDFLFGGAIYQLPTLNDACRWRNRVHNNLCYYQTNYMLTFVSLVVVIAIIHPEIFIGFSWLLFSIVALELYSRRFSLVTVAIVTYFSYQSFYYQSWLLMVLAFLVPAAAVFVHASLRLRNLNNKLFNRDISKWKHSPYAKLRDWNVTEIGNVAAADVIRVIATSRLLTDANVSPSPLDRARAAQLSEEVARSFTELLDGGTNPAHDNKAKFSHFLLIYFGLYFLFHIGFRTVVSIVAVAAIFLCPIFLLYSVFLIPDPVRVPDPVPQPPLQPAASSSI